MEMAMPGMNMMKMYFHTGYKEYVLFYDAHTKSPGAMVGACFVVFFVAIFYEGFKAMREDLMRKYGPRSTASITPKSNTSNLDGSWAKDQERVVIGQEDLTWSEAMFSKGHVMQTILHMIQMFISYCLMLVFMTFNVYLCLAVVLGIGLGYFIFGVSRGTSVDSNEHCQ